MKLIKIIPLFAILIACGGNLPELIDLSRHEFHLVNQDGREVIFPENIKGKITVAGYIFTNCPDICPLTTNNMRLLKERLEREGISEVNFVSISFDPANDTPEVLKKYAEIRNLDAGGWEFLTGSQSEIDSLMKTVEVLAVPGDSTTLANGKKIYYYVHTDRIQLIDRDGIVRKNYPGSKLNLEEIYADIKKLM
ncbi:SCO family protein [Melioribacter sp. Ez-97]|uniref:SCO family protein n=1 Tax=Melioribacter sp. Ez-97 TaxID=3423434 RepID=UPI003EDA2336